MSKLKDEEELSSGTDPGKAEEPYRSFKEEPGDDDGENRNPTERASIIETSFLVCKQMVGSGVLNTPLIFKTFGITYGIVLAFLFNFLTVFSTYSMMKCKQITQRYSYAVYSKMVMGLPGTILNKVCLIIMSFACCCVYLIIMGDLIKSLVLLFIENKAGTIFTNPKFYMLVVAVVLLAFIFQKDISGIRKLAPLGIIALFILFVSLVILYLHKSKAGEILPVEPRMYQPSGSYYDLFKCFGGFFNAYFCQSGLFPYYLPIKPRKTKSIVLAYIIGSFYGTSLYIVFGILGFFIYRYDIQDSIIKYFEKDLLAFKGTNGIMFTVMVVCEIAFLINVSISTLINMFVVKQNSIGLVKFLYGKFAKKDEKSQDMIELQEEGKITGEIKSKTEEFPGTMMQNVITFICYVLVVVVSITSDKIISVDNFNGSTVSNYLALIAPSFFYLYFSWGKGFNLVKPFNLFSIGIGLFLIGGYFYNLFAH